MCIVKVTYEPKFSKTIIDISNRTRKAAQDTLRRAPQNEAGKAACGLQAPKGGWSLGGASNIWLPRNFWAKSVLGL